MSAESPIEKSDRLQTRIQSFAYVIAAGVCMLACVYFAASHVLGPERANRIELDEKINPNVAPVGNLMRLPGIGIGRAGAIVAYREDFGKTNSGGPAFKNADDLQKIKGIGPKTAKNMRQWLKFE
jgi:competence ComEA-like helix-hairpin-helix protein